MRDALAVLEVLVYWWGVGMGAATAFVAWTACLAIVRGGKHHERGFRA